MYADMIIVAYHLTEQALMQKNIEVSFSTGSGRRKRFVNTAINAPKSAEKVHQLAEETKGYIQQYKCLLYKYNALLEAFPGIEQYVDGKESLIALNNFSDLERKSRYYQLKNRIVQEQIKLEQEREKLQNEKNEISQIVDEASIGSTKWLSSLLADYYSAADGSLVEEYKNKKFPISAEKAKELYAVINGQLREYRIQNKELKYLLAYYQECYPELEQTTPEDMFENDSANSENEQVELSASQYYRLSKEEYAKLEPAEKNQLALDNYWKKRKTKWIIGRDYERYIGYKFEKLGYRVLYQGAIQGMDDLGIDLICENKDKILLIQCKYWKQGFPIRENAVCQLYGTSIKYQHELKTTTGHQNSLFSDIDLHKPIEMWLITSSELSATASEFAKVLGVKVRERVPLETYPIIKCNIAADGNKIYHLPFDQQYDNTKIEYSGEFYAMTIKEAENAGFRRAYRWHGN
jgi:Holliday junction resolvase